MINIMELCEQSIYIPRLFMLWLEHRMFHSHEVQADFIDYRGIQNIWSEWLDEECYSCQSIAKYRSGEYPWFSSLILLGFRACADDCEGKGNPIWWCQFIIDGEFRKNTEILQTRRKQRKTENSRRAKQMGKSRRMYKSYLGNYCPTRL